MAKTRRALTNGTRKFGTDVAVKRSTLATTIRRNRKTHRKQGYRVKGFGSSVTGLGFLAIGGKGFGRGTTYSAWRNKITGAKKRR